MSLMYFVLSISIFQMSGCNPVSIEKVELIKNRQLWQQNKIQNYSFTCERIVGGAFSFRPEQIEVRGGKVVFRATIDGSKQNTSWDGYSDIETVEKIFDVIQKSDEAGQKVKVTYNEKLGYPEEARINVLGGPDKPYTVKITNFKIS